MSTFSHSHLIWLSRRDRAQNRYLAFQKEFRLGKVPAAARIHISAYAYYQVAVNGVVVGRGPDPSNHRRYYYDTYDVQACLRRGRNVINVLAYAFGPVLPWPETSYLSGETGWLQFELASRDAKGRSTFIGSDATCRVRPADAWTRRAPGYTELRAAYKEYYDARKFGFEALAPTDTRGRDWHRAVELAPSDLEYAYAFRPKEIRDFRWKNQLPVAAYTIDGGFAYGFTAKRGWQIENPETLIKDYPLTGYADVFRQGEPNFPKDRVETKAADQCMIHRAPGCGTASLWVDFGDLQYGLFRLELETAAPGSVIDIGYGESPHITYVDRYTTRAGVQSFTPFHYRAGRYVLLTFSKIAAPIHLQAVRFQRCEYPVKNNPDSFVSSSERLNRIETKSISTLHLNMHSHFEDCPWREQKLYLGDMYVEALATYYAWGEYDYVGKNLRQLAARDRADGWIKSGPGNSRGNGLIVDFPIYFAIELRDHHLFSGDRKTLAALYPQAVKILENYLEMGWRREGLVNIGKADSFANWCVINWNDVVKKGHCAPLNFLVARGLAAVTDMAEWLGRPEDIARFRGLMGPLRRAIDAAFWSPAKGLYRDGCYEGRPIEHYSTETNTLALLSGLPDRRKTRRILDALEAGRLSPETPTAYFNAFVTEGLFRNKRTAAAMQLIETCWGGMLERGADAFWEILLPQTPARCHPPKGISLCHGWASGPAYLLPAYVLGIRPIEPGFRSFAVDPQLATLKSAAGVVPTPHGPITLRYESGVIRVRHPRSTTPVISKKLGLPPGVRIVVQRDGKRGPSP
jgi:hypothetical protein